MKKLVGFNNKGETVVVDCAKHYYKDLPMKGLGKSMEGIGLNEHVIFPCYVATSSTWEFTKAEIERRAIELKAQVKWVAIPPDSIIGSDAIQMWFTSIEQCPHPSEMHRTSEDGGKSFCAQCGKTFPQKRVKYTPPNCEETYRGTVVIETDFSYVVIPDDDLSHRVRWSKKCCQVLIQTKLI